MVFRFVIDAPKVGTVNEQVRAGAGERNTQVADLSTTNAMSKLKLYYRYIDVDV